MASIPAVLRHVRRARRESTQRSAAEQFQEYETAYEEILLAVRAVGDEELLEAVGDWAIEWTDQNRRLPTPEQLRTHARSVLREHDHEIPPELQQR